MPITERSDRKDYPGALVVITNPFTCGVFPNFQALAFAIQGGIISGKGGTIVSGRILTNLTDAQMTTICSV